MLATSAKKHLHFLVLENMRRVKYQRCDVIPVVVLGHIKILCKDLRQNQLWLSFERKLVRLFKMESKFVIFVLYVFVIKLKVVDSQSQTTVSF